VNEGTEIVNIAASAEYVEKNIIRLDRIKAQTGETPTYCVVCMKPLTSKSTKIVWTDDTPATYLISSTKGGDLVHPTQVGPTCFRKLRAEERSA
jgi:hypothetical protein